MGKIPDPMDVLTVPTATETTRILFLIMGQFYCMFLGF